MATTTGTPRTADPALASTGSTVADDRRTAGSGHDVSTTGWGSAPAAGSPRLRSRPRLAALPLGVGGVLIAVGGGLHPRGSGATIDGYLASMLAGATWLPSHLLLLLGTALATVGFVTTRRASVFGPSVDRWLVAATVGWGLATVELVPHLMAVHDADGLAHHHATPVLDLHLALQALTTPLMGLTGAALAIAVARSARTAAAWVLAVPAVLGGLGYAASAPLIAMTGSLAPAALFPLQAGLAVWLVGTWARVGIRRPRAVEASRA